MGGVTPEDIDRVVGDLAAAGRATSTRREYVQIFKGFHRFLQARKAIEIEAAFGVRLVCPVDEFNACEADRYVGLADAELDEEFRQRIVGRSGQPVIARPWCRTAEADLELAGGGHPPADRGRDGPGEAGLGYPGRAGNA